MNNADGHFMKRFNLNWEQEPAYNNKKYACVDEFMTFQV